MILQYQMTAVSVRCASKNTLTDSCKNVIYEAVLKEKKQL